MLYSSDITAFMTNSQIKPTFLEDTVLILTKDYSLMDPVCNRYLKKGVAGVITACGLSRYTFNEDTQTFSTLIDGNEWCKIEVQPSTPDFDYTEGCVMVKDLREFSVEDVEFDSFCFSHYLLFFKILLVSVLCFYWYLSLQDFNKTKGAYCVLCEAFFGLNT